MPFNGAAPPASEVFDEMAEGISLRTLVILFHFRHCLSLARDFLSFGTTVARTMQQPSS